MADLPCTGTCACHSGECLTPCPCVCHVGHACTPTPPTRGRLTFPCGAWLDVVNIDDWRDHQKRGRVRLLVVDTQRRPQRPTHGGGVVAGCLFDCPAKRYRRKQRAMADGPNPFAPRTVVTCSAVLSEDVPHG